MSRLSIDEMKAELDLEFYLERESLAFRHTRGTSGAQLNIKTCPNAGCRDDRWRTYYGLDTGQGNCFVCSRGFNSVSFIKNHMEFDKWGDAFREIESVLKEQGWRPKREVVVAVDPGEVVLPISTPLPTEAGENLQYLESRGFDGSIAKYFHLSWCEFGWWKYKDPEGETKTQAFDNRIIIPVYDLDGTLVTFQGRDLTGTSKMKYLFPKELPGTGRYLLNGHNVVATHEVAMGEGAFDVAAMKIAFDGEVSLRHIVSVGSFGKHLSYGSLDGDDQFGRFIQLKARGVTTVTIMWDGEIKALEAALNTAKLLSGLGLKVRIALLPFEKDPNEVTPDVVRKAYFEAELWTPALDVRWRLRNPYKPGERIKRGLSKH